MTFNIVGSKLDITGQIFGNLTVVRPSEARSGKSILWECQCNCGNTIKIRKSSLLGNAKYKGKRSCGCLSSIRVGEKREMLTVVEVIDASYKCLCDCGNYTTIHKSALGRTKSCGCISWRVFNLQLVNEEELDNLGHLLDLSDNEKEILRLTDLLGLTIPKAAEMLGKSKQYISKQRLRIYDNKIKPYMERLS